MGLKARSAPPGQVRGPRPLQEGSHSLELTVGRGCDEVRAYAPQVASAAPFREQPHQLELREREQDLRQRPLELASKIFRVVASPRSPPRAPAAGWARARAREPVARAGHGGAQRIQQLERVLCTSYQARSLADERVRSGRQRRATRPGTAATAIPRALAIRAAASSPAVASPSTSTTSCESSSASRSHAARPQRRPDASAGELGDRAAVTDTCASSRPAAPCVERRPSPNRATQPDPACSAPASAAPPIPGRAQARTVTPQAETRVRSPRRTPRRTRLSAHIRAPRPLGASVQLA